MEPSQYKDYVLVLLFVKYVSDKYANDPNALITIPKGGGFKDMQALKGQKDIGEQRDSKAEKAARVPADLLEEVFELNMQLEELRTTSETGQRDQELQAGLEQAKRRFDGLLVEVDQDLRMQWKKWDEGNAAMRKSAEKSMVALLDRRHYLSNLVRDVTETLGA
jgi:type I restriction-modification system DNA methylase subunit